MARWLATDNDQTRTGSILGTPAYMTPEQAAGNRKAIGPGTGIFSLGVILYELLPGSHPFQKDSPLATLHAIQHDDRPLLAETGCPKCGELNLVLSRCLAKDPANRYLSAKRLAVDLEQCVAPSQPTAALPAQRASNQRRRLAGISVICAVLGSLALGLSHLKDLSRHHQLADSGSGNSAAQVAAIGKQISPAGEGIDFDMLHRRVAGWILEHGGGIFIVSPNGQSLGCITDPAAVPDEPFVITAVWVSYVSEIGNAEFADLLNFPKCAKFHSQNAIFE